MSDILRRTHPCTSRQSIADGKQVEGAVAQVMWDMIDPATSDDPLADDAIRVSANYLATVMRSCRVTTGPPRGIDDLLVCLGQSLPASDFPRQPVVSTPPSASPGQTDVWSYAAMQRIWMMDLFLRS